LTSERVIRDEIAALRRALPARRILCVGEVSWDFAEVPDGSVATTGGPGGCALNTAVALRWLGAGVTLAGNPLGLDAHGDAIVAALAAKGIEALVPRRAGIATPSCRCLVDRATGERAFVVSHADIQTPALDAIPVIAARIARGAYSHVFVQPYVEPLADALLARIAGAPVWIAMQDVAPDSPFVARGDALQISRDDADPAALAALAAPFFRGRMAELIVTAGARGAAWIARGEPPRWFAAVPVAPVVDTTGCGDAFRAGFMFARACGQPIDACFALAHRLGALKACLPGSTVF